MDDTLMKDAAPPGESFGRRLEALINEYSEENGSNTPDFLLADYLLSCLVTFNAAVNRREAWYGRVGRSESPRTVDAVDPVDGIVTG